MLLTEHQVAEFDRNGFVVIPGLLAEEELSRCAVAVRDAVARRKRKDQRSLAAKSPYEQSFLQCINLWEDFPAVRELTFHRHIAQAAAELLGAGAVRLWHDQALFKEPAGRKTDLHQDLPYWTMAENDALTAWIPFAGSTLENGCMGYVAGSHRAGVRRLVNIFRAGAEDLDAQARELLTGELTHVEVPAGSVAFHHGLTAHDARPNRTAETREVHTMIFFRDGITRSEEGSHFAVDRAAIAPGAPIASAVTPVAWPRPAGDLPAPPPPMTGIPAAWRDAGTYPGTPDR